MHVAPATQSVRGRVAPAPRVSHYAGEDLEGEEALAALEADDAPPPARTASAGASAVAARTGSCIECHAADGQPKFRDAFGLEVCFDCQRAHRGAGGKYRVISKSTAKTEYMLSDSALDGAKGGLGSFAVPNPHDARYGEMRLYLQSQAAAADARASIAHHDSRWQRRMLATARAYGRRAAAEPCGVHLRRSRRRRSRCGGPPRRCLKRGSADPLSAVGARRRGRSARPTAG